MSSTSNEPAKKKRIPKILDGKYFTVVRERGKNLDAVCMTCKKECSGSYNGTRNFADHYSRVHPEKYDELVSYRDGIETSSQKNTLDKFVSVQPVVSSTVNYSI